MRLAPSSVRAAATALLVALMAVTPAFGQSSSATGQGTVRSPSPLPGLEQGPDGPVLRIGIEEAVRIALEQNLNVQAERYTPAIQDQAIEQAQGQYVPNLLSSFSFLQRDQPPTSLLSGAEDVISSDNLSAQVGVQQALPWYGGRFEVSWDNSRSSTNNFFAAFNPQLNSTVSAIFSQPLLRNFGIDATRQQLEVSRKNREIAGVQLRQTIAQAVRQVKGAYWLLVYQINLLKVRQQSLELARESLKNNRSRVEVGTMAPIDIIEAQAEVARNEETVIIAEAAIKQAEDLLRSLMLDPATPDFWSIRIEPTEPPTVQPQPIEVEAAVERALGNRTDLIQARKSLEVGDVNIRYFHNQTLPDLNVTFNYSPEGVGGKQLQREPGFPPGPVIGTTAKRFWSVQQDILAGQYPTWSVSVNFGYPIGTSPAESSLAKAKLEYQKAEMQIRNIELQVGKEVRNAARTVSTNLKRVDATRASRELAQRRLEAEQKKFTVGLSTTFLVFQAQRDLTEASNNELQAITDYLGSVVEFEAVQEIGSAGAIVSIGLSR